MSAEQWICVSRPRNAGLNPNVAGSIQSAQTSESAGQEGCPMGAPPSRFVGAAGMANRFVQAALGPRSSIPHETVVSGQMRIMASP